MDVTTSSICIPYLFYDAYFCAWAGIWELSVEVRIRVKLNFQVTVVPFPTGSKYFPFSNIFRLFLVSHSGGCFGRAKRPEHRANRSSQSSTEA